MKPHAIEKIRNIGFVSHGGAGKTSLAEAILFHSGANSRIGKVDDGTSIMNYDPEEIKRKTTLGSSLAFIEWKEHKFNILDNPGFDDFIGEVHKVVTAIDSAIVVVNSSSGVEVGTEKNWKILNSYNVPRIVFLSKLDKENINLEKVFSELKTFDPRITPIQVPLGTGQNLRGVIDLIEMKALADTDESGKKTELTDIPAEFLSHAQKLREPMIESIVECDDDLLNKFFDGNPISNDELRSALKIGITKNKIKPLLCGMSLKNIGTEPLLDFIMNCMPSPLDRGPVEAQVPGGTTKQMVAPSIDSPASGFIFKKINEQAGDILFIRCVSGKFVSGNEYMNTTKDNFERLSNFSTLRGKAKTDLEMLTAGDIAVLVKPK
ncbi:GTP-binding protein, partial [bacterium]|nr:GTP-binding protein [bacterium]